jgi:EpsI family protein
VKLKIMAWLPAILLSAGAAASAGAGAQRSTPLRARLADVTPLEMLGLRGVDQTVSEQERRVAGMDEYLLRSYAGADSTSAGFSIYVGYYQHQARGHTIHSPKNCLPGAGWEALTSATAAVPIAGASVQVTKYLLQRNDERAVVLYWYQGRGRVENNEYVVKWDLLRDAALRRRSDEALVRVVVPIATGENEALAVATAVASQLIPAVDEALPTW